MADLDGFHDVYITGEEAVTCRCYGGQFSSDSRYLFLKGTEYVKKIEEMMVFAVDS